MRFSDAPTAATFYSVDAKARDRFSYRHRRNASAAPGNFVRRPKKIFATISALNGHGAMSELSPLTQDPHLTPHVRASACSLGSESTKQAEIRLANSLKILRNFGSGGQYRSPMRETMSDGCFSAISVGYG
jgi:hypothetical protein